MEVCIRIYMDYNGIACLPFAHNCGQTNQNERVRIQRRTFISGKVEPVPPDFTAETGVRVPPAARKVKASQTSEVFFFA